MSDLPPPPPPLSPDNEPTRAGDATSPEPRSSSSELPRRGYGDDPRRMKPPPPPPRGYSQQQASPPPIQPQTLPPPTAARKPRPSIKPASRADSGLYLPWWSLVILLVVVGIGVCAMLFGVSELANTFILEDQTPQVVVVTSALNPSNSGDPNAEFVPPGSVPNTPVAIPTAVPQAQPTPTTSLTSAEGCPRNTMVMVTGTGGDGLLVRSEPRQGQNITYVAADGEEFMIIEGPQNSVGVGGESIEWCQIQNLADDTIVGWAATTFLQVAGQ